MLAGYPAVSSTLLWLWTLLAWTAALGTLGAVLTAWRAPAWFAVNLRPLARPLTIAVAAVTVAGSLALSELHGFLPCSLCWVQRGLLYPLLFVVPFATRASAARWLRRVVYVVTAVSVAFALYQIGIERGLFAASTACEVGRSTCAAIWTRRAGMTIPTMAAVSAVAIGVGTRLAAGASRTDR